MRLIVRGESEPVDRAIRGTAGEKVPRGNWKSPQIEHRVLGPAPCPIAKLRGLFRYHVLLSSPDGDELRPPFAGVIESLEPVDGVQWVVDVDPVDLL